MVEERRYTFDSRQKERDAGTGKVANTLSAKKRA